MDRNQVAYGIIDDCMQVKSTNPWLSNTIFPLMEFKGIHSIEVDTITVDGIDSTSPNS